MELCQRSSETVYEHEEREGCRVGGKLVGLRVWSVEGSD